MELPYKKKKNDYHLFHNFFKVKQGLGTVLYNNSIISMVDCHARTIHNLIFKICLACVNLWRHFLICIHGENLKTSQNNTHFSFKIWILWLAMFYSHHFKVHKIRASSLTVERENHRIFWSEILHILYFHELNLLLQIDLR